MKKILGSLAIATLIATNIYANDSKECATLENKIAFGAIGITQGAVIGGPIGAIWGLGTVIYANMVDDCIPSSEVSKNETNDAKEETITLITQQGSDNKDSMNEIIAHEEVVNDLDKVQKEENEVSTPVSKEVKSFVNFGYDRYNVKNINVDLNTLNLNTASKITIQGHTDAKGTDEYNFALGLRRAQSVKDYLIKQNISENKLSTMSFGETAPISSKASENRRVDLVIQYK